MAVKYLKKIFADEENKYFHKGKVHYEKRIFRIKKPYITNKERNQHSLNFKTILNISTIQRT